MKPKKAETQPKEALKLVKALPLTTAQLVDKAYIKALALRDTVFNANNVLQQNQNQPLAVEENTDMNSRLLATLEIIANTSKQFNSLARYIGV